MKGAFLFATVTALLHSAMVTESRSTTMMEKVVALEQMFEGYLETQEFGVERKIEWIIYKSENCDRRLFYSFGGTISSEEKSLVGCVTMTVPGFTLPVGITSGTGSDLEVQFYEAGKTCKGHLIRTVSFDFDTCTEIADGIYTKVISE
eukprot:Awhi_evm1s3996